MKKRQWIKKLCSLCLVAGLLITGVSGIVVSAQRKPVLSKKKLVISVGQKARLQVKNTAKKVKWTSKNCYGE